MKLSIPQSGRRLLISFVCFVVLISSLRTDGTAQSGQTGSGELPAMVIKTAKMNIPKTARRTGLEGMVRVLVQIDSTGKASGVDEVVGPGTVCPQVSRPDVVAVRAAAKDAALRSKFKAATSDGRARPSSIWLDFLVGPPDKPTSKLTQSPASGEINFSAVSADGELAKTLSGGVLDHKAISLPSPPYPRSARAVRASGSVEVQVLIDENGDIFSAEAVSGHPLLRRESVIAACGAKFRPTLLSGSPVKVSGRITYNFVP